MAGVQMAERVSVAIPPPPSALFASAEAPLAPLDLLARSLWLGGITHSSGELSVRLGALQTWRDALLAGHLPSLSLQPGWPKAPLFGRVHAVIESLGLAGFCKAQPEVVEMLLQSLLLHLDLIVDYRDRGDDLEQSELRAVAAFAAEWSERCGEMAALVEVFGELGDLLKHCRWDMLQGLLRSGNWQEVVRIRRLIEDMPELSALIRALGRSHASDQIDPHAHRLEPVMEQASVPTANNYTRRVPDLPGETRGIIRSGRIARMLPAEAMLLNHPRLRLVWHARHAERCLLSYEDDDSVVERRQHAAPVLRPSLVPAAAPRMQMGPMLVCVDTSGSMQGGAENVAKALVLEAARVAHAQGRPCHVFAFSGPDEVVEMVLSFDADGLTRLSRFLGQSFGGGTDIGAPLTRMLEVLEAADWRLADLLIASDGEFGATPALARRLLHAREQLGLRVQAVLIGDRETIGLLELADHIHWVRDWRRYGGKSAASPVHSMSLTATYFPGALRSPENRSATLSGSEASAAIRAGRRTGG